MDVISFLVVCYVVSGNDTKAANFLNNIQCNSFEKPHGFLVYVCSICDNCSGIFIGEEAYAQNNMFNM